MYVKHLIKNRKVLALIGMCVPIILASYVIFGSSIFDHSKKSSDKYIPDTSLPITDDIKIRFNPRKRRSISFVDETISVDVARAQNSLFKAKLINHAQEIEIPVETKAQKINSQEYLVTLEPLDENIMPGRYLLQLEYADGEKTRMFEQDFAWGVLALNTNKATYEPDETALISMGVLDQAGGMVCDAELTLKVSGPGRFRANLKTENGSIRVSPGCHKKEMIMEPDFSTELVLQGEGTYNMELTAVTENGIYTIKDHFEVASYVPYEIERFTATRIYPKEDYPVIMIIKANQDFSGRVQELVPTSYKITGMSEENIAEILGSDPDVDTGGELTTELYKNRKHLIWNVNWQKGKTYYLGYKYDAPNLSPDFHLLGPLQIGDYAEARQWQIAVDDIEIIDVHSSPEQGEDWIVRFETNGQHDLSIIPDDQATIEDDEFTSLFCDGEERTPQILEGDVIFYPNWECDGIGRVVHKTLKAGNHTLRFEFGGEVAYAYNAIWKVGWDYRKPLTITGSTSGSVTDYVMGVRTYYASGSDTSDQVYCGGSCRSDFGDVRFTASDGTTDLSYWRQTYTDGTSASFWVKVDSIPASPSTVNIYMYYGNSSATTTSSGADTFDFFDDFSDDLSQWTIDPENTDSVVYIYSSAGNPSPSLRHDPDSSQTKNSYYDTRIATNSYQFQNGIIEYEVYLAGAARIIHQMGWRVPGTQLGSGYAWRLQNSAADGGHFEFTGIASWSSIGTQYPATSGGTWHSVREIANGSSYTAYVDGGSAYSASDGTTLGANYLVSHVHGVSLTGSSYVLVDNIRTRKYANPEPTYSGWGSEEVPLIDISGTAYTDDDEGTTLNGVDVCAAVDSTFTPGDCDTTSSGVFDIQDVAVSGQNSQPITLFVDGGSTFGNVITNHVIDNISGLKLYQNHILLDSETGSTVTIVDMDAYDNDQNSTDMLFDATDSSPDTLTWESGIELYVPSDISFIPGGNTNGHDIEIDGTWSATSTETINVDGSFKLDTGGVFSAATSTLTFDGGSGTEDLITAGSGDPYNLVIDDGGGGSLVVEVEDPLVVDNDLTISNGSLDVVSGEDNQITVFGDWANDDTLIPRNGTVVLDGASDTNLDSGCSDADTCTNEDFYNLTIQKDEDAQVTLANTHLRVSNLLNIVAGWLIQGTLNIRAEGTTAIDIDDFGRWENTSTGNVTLGGDVINDGNITLNANGMSCGDANSITIASTNTTPRSWSGAGGFRIADVVVSYQTGSAVVYAASSTNNGNMGSNWRFTECNEFLFEGLDFEGLDVN